MPESLPQSQSLDKKEFCNYFYTLKVVKDQSLLAKRVEEASYPAQLKKMPLMLQSI